MVSINVKQRNALLKEMRTARTAGLGWNDIFKRPCALRDLFELLTADERWSLTGRECQKEKKKE